MKTLTATTQKGEKIKISPIIDPRGKNIKINATHNDVSVVLSHTDFMNHSGAFCLKLDARKTKALFGVTIPAEKTAGVKIDQDNGREIISEWKQEQKKQRDTAIEKEISEMNSNDSITLVAFSGYGMHYGLRSEKLSTQAQTNASKHIKQIMKNYETQPAPELKSDVAYKVEITWGEYQEAIEDIDNAEREQEKARKVKKEEKFSQAKETGEAVLLFEETVKEEDLPRSDRAAESSIAFVSVYAMPDGSTKRTVSHAH